jgi:alpha-beta hydrolase superfamily lysophospholipase
MQLEIISRKPASSARPTPLLFVHGAWHAAWCWAEYFLDYFAAHGYESYALSLRGHGGSEGHNRLRWTSINDYVADVAHVAGQLSQTPVLIGHSMGGLVVQNYLKTHTAPAAVLLASVPPTGALDATLRIAKRHPLAFVKAALRLSLYPIIETPNLTREALFSTTMPEGKSLGHFCKMQDESVRAFLDMLFFTLPAPLHVATTMLVMGATDDAVIHPNEIEETAKAYNTQTTVFPGMAHDMMLEPGWQGVADHIRDWLNKQGV